MAATRGWVPWPDVKSQTISGLLVAILLLVGGAIVLWLSPAFVPILVAPVPSWTIIASVGMVLLGLYIIQRHVRRKYRVGIAQDPPMPPPGERVQYLDDFGGVAWYAWVAKDPIQGSLDPERMWIRGPYCPDPCGCELTEVVPAGPLSSVMKIRLTCDACTKEQFVDRTVGELREAVRRRVAAKVRRAPKPS